MKPEHAIYVDAKIAALPQIPALSITDAPGDVAAVAALKPGLSVDYGDVSAGYVAATEKIASELQVPAVIFGSDLTVAAPIVASLGQALGVDARGQALAKAIQDVMIQVKPLADLPDAQRPAVYIARGQDGLQAIRASTSLDEPLRLAGGRNVVAGGGGPFKRMSVADVVALRPAVVIVSDIAVMSSPLHDALPKGTRFVLDAGEPYKVLTGPPSLNRLVGLLALAAILHPDVVRTTPDDVRHLETTLFPIPAGLAEPAPLQVQN